MDDGAGDLRRAASTASPTPASTRCPCSARFRSGWAARARSSQQRMALRPRARRRPRSPGVQDRGSHVAVADSVRGVGQGDRCWRCAASARVGRTEVRASRRRASSPERRLAESYGFARRSTVGRGPAGDAATLQPGHSGQRPGRSGRSALPGSAGPPGTPPPVGFFRAFMSPGFLAFLPALRGAFAMTVPFRSGPFAARARPGKGPCPFAGAVLGRVVRDPRSKRGSGREATAGPLRLRIPG